MSFQDDMKNKADKIREENRREHNKNVAEKAAKRVKDPKKKDK